MEKTFYITTPIYYANNNLHIGHTYCSVVADTIARYKKLRGFDVKFLTGTDEHGQKVERMAKEKGTTPQNYVDEIVVWIRDLWKTLGVEYDYFSRTTNKQHVAAVQKIFKQLYDQGDIYKGHYEGLYCTPCETFFTEIQLVNGKCPDCGRDVETMKEEAYFLALSKYQDRLVKFYDDNPDFVEPKSQLNEMLNSFIKPGLEDVCVSRTTLTWGVPVDFDPGHVVYVWIDALSNYITALGFLSEDDTDFKKYWPADVHLVGKDISRFHSIIWPIMLMALNKPMPKKVFVTGLLKLGGDKMSKSKGNVIDPKVLIERYGIDAVRYFLMREMPLGMDGNFTNESLLNKINFDLANDLGNLVSRTSSMIDKYFAGQLPVEKKATEFDAELIRVGHSAVAKAEAAYDIYQTSEALAETWNLVRRANKYVDETCPWIVAKDESQKDVLSNILYNLAESLRIVSVLIKPVMPTTSKTIATEFNFDENIVTWDSIKEWGLTQKDLKITKGAIIFPRIDIKKELESLIEIMPITEKIETKVEKKAEVIEEQKEITIDDFSKVSLKVGQVIACEKVKGSDKLLKSQIKIGEEVRQIVSGIAAHYTPEEMVGKKVVVVVNLKPVKLRGEMSYGMILAAENTDGKLGIVSVDDFIESGAEVR